MNKILVTGGAGFIGSNLVDLLLSENEWQVIVVDNFDGFYSPQIKRANISAHVENPNFRLFEIDICDYARLREVFASTKFDVIVHLAARAGVRPSINNPALYVETNVLGTTNLLELAREYNVPRFVFGSSSSVYGINSKVPFSESDIIAQPISPYAATKAAGELLCHTYSHLFGIRCVCLRFFTVYGARQRPDLAIHKFTRMITDNQKITVFGDGTTRRDYTYVDDIVSGVRAAIDFDASEYDIFNLGNSRTVELSELISTLENTLDKKAIIERLPMQPGDVPQTFADISKSEKMLGFNPQTPFETGIKHFVNWFREQRN